MAVTFYGFLPLQVLAPDLKGSVLDASKSGNVPLDAGSIARA